MFEAKGIVTKIEVWALILPSVEYFYAIIAQILLAKDRVEKILWLIRQLYIVAFCENLIE
jgi:hypothetical protein